MTKKLTLDIGTTPNYARVTLGSLILDFSYRTVIAFSTPDTGEVSENAWGPTTGKHLNWIDGGTKAAKSYRLPRAEFKARLSSTLEHYGIEV